MCLFFFPTCACNFVADFFFLLMSILFVSVFLKLSLAQEELL